MQVWILDMKSLGNSGGVEFFVGADKCDRELWLAPLSKHKTGELNSVGAAKRLYPRHGDGVLHHRLIQFDQIERIPHIIV